MTGRRYLACRTGAPPAYLTEKRKHPACAVPHGAAGGTGHEGAGRRKDSAMPASLAPDRVIVPLTASILAGLPLPVVALGPD